MAAIIPYCATGLEHLLGQVTRVLQQGGITAIPTETFYGLGVNPFDRTALTRLCAVKRRAEGQPILVLLGSLDDLPLFVDCVPPAASLLMEVFWPGALTIVLPARASIPPALTAGTGRVGVRLSPCQPLRQLLDSVGPLTGTSANRSGTPPALTAGAVQEVFGDDVDLIIDAGSMPGGRPSTVVDAGDRLHIVREGAVSRSEIETALRERGFSLKHA
jgi:L-threonylcarbamoyladenylate synthase